ncbi:hypothetical protein DLJ61_00160 [Gordonia terrae]|uniref:Uncharacterized protein n=1 Tax=Gordonia terrae TaxID=2055 RepID=A0AAD0K385_9ACTN|nr:hypothetical protein BCM27_00160 [Gordonia terrae]AWO82188.1 hypothetical protein DLJ61_00160 [Gordonia terrae]
MVVLRESGAGRAGVDARVARPASAGVGPDRRGCHPASVPRGWLPHRARWVSARDRSAPVVAVPARVGAVRQDLPSAPGCRRAAVPVVGPEVGRGGFAGDRPEAG